MNDSTATEIDGEFPFLNAAIESTNVFPALGLPTRHYSSDRNSVDMQGIWASSRSRMRSLMNPNYAGFSSQWQERVVLAVLAPYFGLIHEGPCIPTSAGTPLPSPTVGVYTSRDRHHRSDNLNPVSGNSFSGNEESSEINGLSPPTSGPPLTVTPLDSQYETRPGP